MSMNRAATPLAAAVATIATALAAGSAASADGDARTAAKRVTVRDNFFSPGAVSVRRGTTVKWTWRSTANPHNVRVRSGPVKFRSATKRSGSYSKRIRKRGTYSIYCSIHPRAMKMSLKAR